MYVLDLEFLMQYCKIKSHFFIKLTSFTQFYTNKQFHFTLFYNQENFCYYADTYQFFYFLSGLGPKGLTIWTPAYWHFKTMLADKEKGSFRFPPGDSLSTWIFHFSLNSAAISTIHSLPSLTVSFLIQFFVVWPLITLRNFISKASIHLISFTLVAQHSELYSRMGAVITF